MLIIVCFELVQSRGNVETAAQRTHWVHFSSIIIVIEDRNMRDSNSLIVSQAKHKMGNS